MIPGAGSRGLTSRSVILSILLGLDGSDAPVSGILSICRELGLRESAVRVALTRLVAASDLERVEGRYGLSPRLRERQHRQEAALHPVTREPWDGRWHMVVVMAGSMTSTDRADFRDAMRTARLRSVRSGVWMRPANLDLTLAPAIRDAVSVYSAEPEEPSKVLSGRLFDVDSWAATARNLTDRLISAGTVVERFELAAAAVRHILDDPVLPAELLPPDWPGSDLRAAYVAFRDELTTLGERLLAG